MKILPKIKINNVSYFNPLENKIDEIIEYFVKFYGEKYRKRIEDRIKSITFIFVPSLNKSFGEMPSKAIEKMLVEENGESVEGANFDTMIESLRHANDYFSGKVKNDSVSKLSMSKELKILKKWEDKLDEMTAEYFGRLTQYFQQFFPNAEIDKEWQLSDIESIIKKGRFSLKNYNQYEQNDFLRLSKALGEKYQTFEECVQDEEYLKKLFKTCHVDKMHEETKILANQRIQSEFFGENTKKILDLDKKGGDLYIFENMYSVAFGGFSAPSGFACSFLDKKGDVKNLICYSLSDFQRLNCLLIHEINHVVESDILNINEKVFTEKCGFDILDVDYSENYFIGDNLFAEEEFLWEEYQNRRYECLNETINDYLSQKICSLMEKDGFHLAPQADWQSKSDYKFGYVFVKDIIDRNFDKIVSCRFSENPNALAEIIGQENLEKWADIVDTWMMRSKYDMPDYIPSFINKLNDMIYEYSKNSEEKNSQLEQ